MTTIHSGYDINELYREAQNRWLKPAEVLYILQNHENLEFTQELPQRPASGSLLLYNKRVLRYFRRDGHSWRKKRDGKTINEAHERLKVGNVEALNCYYAHGEHNPHFNRRSFWMLDPAYEHIVLVQYREVTEGSRVSSGSTSQLSPGASSSSAQTPISNTMQEPGSTSINEDLNEIYRSISSPGSSEVSSKIITGNVGLCHLDSMNLPKELYGSGELGKALKKLEEQLSLDDDSFKEIGPFCTQDNNFANSQALANDRETINQNQYGFSPNGLDYPADKLYYGRYAGLPDSLKNHALHKDEGGIGNCYNQSFSYEDSSGNDKVLSWDRMHDSWKNASSIQLQESSLSPSRTGPFEEHGERHWSNVNGITVEESPQVGSFGIPPYATSRSQETNMDYYTTLFDQGQMGMPLEEGLSLTMSQEQKFKIREVSPEWGYTTEATKVFIIGSFLCDPSESTWTCMFDDFEVPLQIIQEGVVCCEAPPHPPGKVTLCITSGNRQSCSEIREFAYRATRSSWVHHDCPPREATQHTEELLLLVRFVQTLLSDPPEKTDDSVESGIHLLRKQKANDDLWSYIIEALLVGTGTSSSTKDWLLQELMKDKLQQWCSSFSQRSSNQSGCSLSMKDQGIIHMVAGLGYEWALNSILSFGVNINFRDINGWTALHWAARFGREEMVATLIASGADAWAVTDPTSQDPTGKTPASIAAASGHKGLAGYLSEVALTGHLLSLKLEENELSKGTAAVQAEMTVNNISRATLAHQSSLKDTLAAVRNAAQAAARIQSVFRAHSFRKRQQQEAVAVAVAVANAKAIDEYGFDSADIQGFPAMSKLALGNARDYNLAALSIQKKYRGWKGRRDFLAFRQKVVKIQAHVRGYQVRKQYKVICWTVGVLEKVILRWRRKGVGLRGFRQDHEPSDESDDEDIAKLFRKQKVDAAVDDAVSHVLTMVDNPEARKQYRRMLERYRQAKTELAATGEAVAPNSIGGIIDMENEEFHFP